jgi:hypothetical protein
LGTGATQARSSGAGVFEGDCASAEGGGEGAG